jgi:hypothetical protein
MYVLQQIHDLLMTHGNSAVKVVSAIVTSQHCGLAPNRRVGDQEPSVVSQCYFCQDSSHKLIHTRLIQSCVKSAQISPARISLRCSPTRDPCTASQVATSSSLLHHHDHDQNFSFQMC